MNSGILPHGGWRRYLYPIMGGAGAGLVGGLLGALATGILYGTYLGGLAGAICCGVTATYLSEEIPPWNVTQALVADVLSSVVVFVSVLVAYLAYVWFSEGLTIFGAVWFTIMYLGIGGLAFALPIGSLSLGITGITGVLTVLLKRCVINPLTAG